MDQISRQVHQVRSWQHVVVPLLCFLFSNIGTNLNFVVAIWRLKSVTRHTSFCKWFTGYVQVNSVMEVEATHSLWYPS